MSLYDSADITVGHSGGNVLLRRVKNFRPSDGSTREGFIPVGSQVVVGTVRKPGEITIELEEMPDTVPEVPWEKLKESGEVITVTIQYRAGAELGERKQYRMQVAEVADAEGDQGGDYGRSIKLIAIGRPVKLR